MPTMNDALGQLVAPATLVLERMLPGPIDRVWAFLTESEKRQQWIAAGDMDLRVGGAVELIFENDDLSPVKEVTPEKYKDSCDSGATMQGHILAVEPPHLLSYTWSEGEDGESEVTFELEAVGDKVKLTLTHRKLFDNEMLVGVSAGWHAHVDIMIDVLEGKTPRPFWSNHMALEDAYRKHLFPEAS